MSLMTVLRRGQQHNVFAVRGESKIHLVLYIKKVSVGVIPILELSHPHKRRNLIHKNWIVLQKLSSISTISLAAQKRASIVDLIDLL